MVPVLETTLRTDIRGTAAKFVLTAVDTLTLVANPETRKLMFCEVCRQVKLDSS